MSESVIGHGTTLKYKAIGTITIGNITNISGPSVSADDVDKSTMESTDKWREFDPAMLDAGEITFTVNYDGSALGTANDLNNAIGITDTWTVTFIDTSKWECSGYLKALGTAVSFDGIVTQDVTIKLTGEPTFTDVEPAPPPEE